MSWVTQGPIADRTTEHLGRSDIGVAMRRKMFREQTDVVASGGDPLGTIRERHERIDLPREWTRAVGSLGSDSRRRVGG